MWHEIADPADPAVVAAVASRARHAVARCGETVVVAIDGPSGSGKTTLASGVVEALGDMPCVHMDELYPGWDGLAAAVGLLVLDVLEPIAAGRAAAYPVWDWERDGWGPRKELPATPLLVIEGCGSSVGRAGEYAAVRVWVEAPREERMARGIARDGEAYRPQWERWATQEDAVFTADGTREHADLVVETGRQP